MKNVVKKIAIYSMVAIMQVGLGASVIEASPVHNNHYEQRADREHRIQAENARYERAMMRHEHESEVAWHERQEREKAHHEEIMRTIGGLALLYILTNN